MIPVGGGEKGGVYSMWRPHHEVVTMEHHTHRDVLPRGAVHELVLPPSRDGVPAVDVCSNLGGRHVRGAAGLQVIEDVLVRGVGLVHRFGALNLRVRARHEPAG